ncbi:hypothetical protein [Staphylococcus pseudoxylosus]|uniref:hypothetical protein n=1 Tax=Staphylococcus pseudoxylosus TaxID=2282419 RepID=UPI001939F762|nr:hypothetical protein [Staphylococcus pseudoxylosus]MBM2659663.1 hypothetical protein [Staphylococcus pseudoxylosus]
MGHYSDSMDDYLNRHFEKMNRRPTMIINYDEHYIIVEDTDENIEKFNNLVKSTGVEKVPDDYSVYYNTTDDYHKIFEGFELRNELNERKERECKFENPPIDKEILEITSKEKLFSYLIQDREDKEEAIIHEYSIDMDLDYKILEAEQKELKRLADRYLLERD